VHWNDNRVSRASKRSDFGKLVMVIRAGLIGAVISPGGDPLARWGG
jgi:hypothetical protein